MFLEIYGNTSHVWTLSVGFKHNELSKCLYFPQIGGVSYPNYMCSQSWNRTKCIRCTFWRNCDVFLRSCVCYIVELPFSLTLPFCHKDHIKWKTPSTARSKRFFPSPAQTKVHTSSGAHPASSSMGTSILSQVKQPGHEVNHLLPSSAEVRIEWSCISALCVCLRSIWVQLDSQFV